MRFPGVAQLAVISVVVVCLAAMLLPIPLTMKQMTSVASGDVKEALRHLRAVLDGGAEPTAFKPAGEFEGNHVPLILTVWRDGERFSIYQVDAEPFGAAIRTLSNQLADSRAALAVGGHRVRLSLDAVVAEGWVPNGNLLFSLAFIDGRNGVSGEINGRRVYATPSELIRLQSYGSFSPLPQFNPQFKIGLDAEQAANAVRWQGYQIGEMGALSRIRRFEAMSVVEGEDLRPLTLLKGTVERPPLTRARLDAAVRAGAKYLVHALRDDAMFRYNYAPLRNKDLGESYGWARHAGTAYSLALVGRLLNEPDFTIAAGRALDRFVAQLGHGPNGSRCFDDQGGCYLGTSALGLLAIAEHRIASGSAKLAPVAHQLAAFIMAMQREDGVFYHDWSASDGIDHRSMRFYASSQSVLALARYASAFGDATALRAAERGMDYLAGPYWNHFLGTYFFGYEHWSCLAAEEMSVAHPKPEYAAFCLAIGNHYDRLCHAPEDTPFPEDVGGMSVTHMFTPHIGGSATAAEAMASAVVLGRATGADVDAITAQLGWTLAFLEKGQLTTDDAFWLPAPERAIGGMLESQTVMKVRIDTLQHAISAMIRGRDLVFPNRSPDAENNAVARDYVVSSR